MTKLATANRSMNNMNKNTQKHIADVKGAGRMVLKTVRRQSKPVLAVGSLMIVAGSAMAQKLEPPPFDVINRHQVNLMSGTAAPTFVDVSIGGDFGLSHSVTTAASDFVNFEAGYGPLGPRDKYFGRISKEVKHKPSENNSTWVMAMKAVSPDGGHDFAIGPGCTRDAAGNVLTYNTFTSHSGDPRHLLEYSSDKKGLVWTRPDGTQVVYYSPGGCFTPAPYAAAGAPSEIGFGSISHIEYPNGFRIQITAGDSVVREVKTNTGFQLTYIFVARTEPADRYLGASQTSQPWAPMTYDSMWGSAVPAYVVAINNTVDFCGSQPSGAFASVAAACPGLTKEWRSVAYSWPVGMPRVAYLTDRTTTFTITDALGGVTKYIHKPFLGTLQSNPQPQYLSRLYQTQKASSESPDVTYDYSTKAVADIGTFMPIYIAGPQAQLSQSAQNTTDTIGYTIGASGGPGTTLNGSGGREGNLSIKTNNTFGTFRVDIWDKVINFEQQQANKLTSIYRKTDGVTIDYGYDLRFNVNEVKENGVITSTALYPTTCSVTTRKTCNQPIWTKDAKGNQTDYEYDANSGHITRVRMPAGQNGVRPEIRYEYQPKYAFYKRSAGGAAQQADTPLYLKTKEIKCSVAAMSATGTCVSGGINDAVITEYEYGAPGVANNLLLRGVSITGKSSGVMQTRRICYSYDIYGNKIGETKPEAGLASCN